MTDTTATTLLPVRLDAWAAVGGSGPYGAPEQSALCLKGYVSGHDQFRDGQRVVTSPIVAADGRLVTTYSGSVYALGEPHPEYVKWCEARGIAIDPDAPVRVHAEVGR